MKQETQRGKEGPDHKVKKFGIFPKVRGKPIESQYGFVISMAVSVFLKRRCCLTTGGRKYQEDTRLETEGSLNLLLQHSAWYIVDIQCISVGRMDRWMDLFKEEMLVDRTSEVIKDRKGQI